MLLDRRADRLGIAGEPRILRADVALEVGELAHELGRLVGLREPRRLARGLAAAEPLDEADQPLRLVGERPRAGKERDRAELGREAVDPLLHVALEGEARVLEPALEHVLVARADDLRLAPVRDDGEPVPPQREVPLILLHRRLDHPLRQ